MNALNKQQVLDALMIRGINIPAESKGTLYSVTISLATIMPLRDAISIPRKYYEENASEKQTIYFFKLETEVLMIIDLELSAEEQKAFLLKHSEQKTLFEEITFQLEQDKSPRTGLTQTFPMFVENCLASSLAN